MTKKTANLYLPGDKSIAHRLVLVSLLLNANITIRNLPTGQDVLTSLKIVRQLGAKVTWLTEQSITITGMNRILSCASSKNEPIIIDCENSGTTVRLLCGILANVKGKYILIGDESLSKRPMERVVKPLSQLMGVDVKSTEGCLPLYLNSTGICKNTIFENVTGSAQVKSAVLFAGMAVQGETRVIEKVCSRDHTERLIEYFKAHKGENNLKFDVPGDVSSSAYFVVLAVITGKRVCFKNILLNPLRTGFVRVLRRMGAVIEEKLISAEWEPVGDLIVDGGCLKATDITAEEIPSVIDELPILAIAMAFAKGQSAVSGASELRIKESDRISCLISQLKKIGVECEEKADGYRIIGGNSIKPAELNSFKDHRLAMSFAILAKCANVELNIIDKDCVNISFPEFWEMMGRI